MTQYTAQYEAGDIADVTIDGIVSIGAFLVSFASLIVLVLLLRMVRMRR